MKILFETYVNGFSPNQYDGSALSELKQSSSTNTAVPIHNVTGKLKTYYLILKKQRVKPKSDDWAPPDQMAISIELKNKALSHLGHLVSAHQTAVGILFAQMQTELIKTFPQLAQIRYLKLYAYS